MTEDTPSTTSIVVRSVSETEWSVGSYARHAPRRASRARHGASAYSVPFCGLLWRGLHVRGDRELFASQLIAFLPFLHSLDLAFDVDDDDTGNGSSGTESDK